MTERTDELDAEIERLQELDIQTYSNLCKHLKIGFTKRPESQRGGWILQGVIQDAIAARGWWWQLSSGGEAFIWNDKRDDKHLIGFSGTGELPAYALLEAYIEAIEEEATR